MYRTANKCVGIQRNTILCLKTQVLKNTPLRASNVFFTKSEMHKVKIKFSIHYKELWPMPGEGLGVGGDAGEGEGEPPHLHHLLNSDTLQI